MAIRILPELIEKIARETEKLVTEAETARDSVAAALGELARLKSQGKKGS